MACYPIAYKWAYDQIGGGDIGPYLRYAGMCMEFIAQGQGMLPPAHPSMRST